MSVKTRKVNRTPERQMDTLITNSNSPSTSLSLSYDTLSTFHLFLQYFTAKTSLAHLFHDFFHIWVIVRTFFFLSDTVLKKTGSQCVLLNFNPALNNALLFSSETCCSSANVWKIWNLHRWTLGPWREFGSELPGWASTSLFSITVKYSN